jgi:hypothetical protein
MVIVKFCANPGFFITSSRGLEVLITIRFEVSSSYLFDQRDMWIFTLYVQAWTVLYGRSKKIHCTERRSYKQLQLFFFFCFSSCFFCQLGVLYCIFFFVSVNYDMHTFCSDKITCASCGGAKQTLLQILLSIFNPCTIIKMACHIDHTFLFRVHKIQRP